MTKKSSKKNEQDILMKPLVETTVPLLEEHKEKPKKQRKPINIPFFQSLSTLMKLRIALTTIFILFTSAIILIFANGYVISAVLLLLGYCIVFFLTIKLFLTKKL